MIQNFQFWKFFSKIFIFENFWQILQGGLLKLFEARFYVGSSHFWPKWPFGIDFEALLILRHKFWGTLRREAGFEAQIWGTKNGQNFDQNFDQKLIKNWSNFDQFWSNLRARENLMRKFVRKLRETCDASAIFARENNFREKIVHMSLKIGLRARK